MKIRNECMQQFISEEGSSQFNLLKYYLNKNCELKLIQGEEISSEGRGVRGGGLS